MLSTVQKQVGDLGYAVLPNCIGEEVLRDLDTNLDARQAGLRNLLSLLAVRQLAISSAVRRLVEPVLGERAFAVRGILFNKLPGANWKVPWHQDCVIAVRERKEVPGWAGWSVKDGVHHVRPPADVLSGMLAVRLHLDNCGEENGALRVIPGSHRHGVISEQQILGRPKEGAVTISARRGNPDATSAAPCVFCGTGADQPPRHSHRVRLR